MFHKKTILHILEGLFVGGAERGLVKLLRYWQNPELEHCIITFSYGPLKSQFEKLGIRPIILSKKRPYDISFLIQLLGMIKDINPDIIHCRNGLTAINYGGLCAKLLRIPLICSIHGHTNFLKKSFGLKFSIWMMKQSSAVIAVSYSIKQDLLTKKIPKQKIKVIHNGIALNNYKIKTSTKISSNNLMIVSVGSLRPVKGHRFLILAVKEIIKEFPNIKLLIIGDGPLRNILENLVKKMGLRNNISFLGIKNNVLDIMATSSLIVVPSLSEGISNVLLEAMLIKKPVVATNVGGNPEVVINGKTGLLVEKENPFVLAKAIITLLKNPELREKMGKEGYKRVVTHFNIDKTVAEYEKVYLKLLCEKS